MQTVQKPHATLLNGIPIYIPNEVIKSDASFYISYNPSIQGYGCDTTAIVLNDPQMTKFYILCGDHREQYKNAATLAACLSYYVSNPKLQHQYSDKI